MSPRNSSHILMVQAHLRRRYLAHRRRMFFMKIVSAATCLCILGGAVAALAGWDTVSSRAVSGSTFALCALPLLILIAGGLLVDVFHKNRTRNFPGA